jgi:hypothetical protein
MRKLNLSEWAQVGEVVGMIGVVMSLLIVAYSVNQNTEALQGDNGNIIFERHAQLSTLFMTDSSLATILVKKDGADPELTDIEAVRWERYQLNLLDIWAMAFNRHRQELLGDEQWSAWNSYFAYTFSEDHEKLSRADWEEFTYGYDVDFWAHVEEAVFGTR